MNGVSRDRQILCPTRLAIAVSKARENVHTAYAAPEWQARRMRWSS